MLNKSKLKHDLYIAQMISNIAHDEASFNIDTRQAFVDNHHAYATLLEELDETIEAMEILKENVQMLWLKVRKDAEQEEINETLKRITKTSQATIAEVVQVYAVALKALEQLGGRNDGKSM